MRGPRVPTGSGSHRFVSIFPSTAVSAWIKSRSRRDSGVSGRSEAAGDRPDARPRNHACPECSTANAGLRFREALAVVALLLHRCIRNPQTDGATKSKTDTLQL